MIFFVTTQNRVGNLNDNEYKIKTQDKAYKNIKRTQATTRQEVEDSVIASNPRQLLAWNQVYSNVSNLEAALIEEAKDDKVCVNMNAQAKKIYGIDVLNGNGGSTLSPTLDNTLNAWCHPGIANIGQHSYNRSNDRRDVPLMQLADWEIGELQANAKLALEELYKGTTGTSGLNPPTHTYGDQLRLVYDIRELARAFIGELTSNPSRRLEKLLAYKLCVSAELEKSLKAMLKTYFDQYPIASTFAQPQYNKLKWSDFPYGSYYLADAKLKPLTEQPLQDLLSQLLKESALVTEAPATTDGTTAAVNTWKKLPPVIRYAIILHDFSRVINPLSIAPLQLQTDGKVLDQLASQNLSAINAEDLNSYTIQPPKRDSGMVDLVNQKAPDGASLSWDTNEYDLANRSYRHHLMPLWNGPSATAGGVVAFWLDQLVGEFAVKAAKTNAEKDNATAISAALFTFTTLYYDRRLTQGYTLTETLSAALIEPIIGKEATHRSVFNALIEENQDSAATKYPINDQSATSDWYITVRDYGYQSNGILVTDPLRIMQLLRASYYKTKQSADYTALATKLKAAHQGVPQSYAVPVFVQTQTDKDKNVIVHLFPKTSTLIDAAL